ncbi:MAG: hypothetical protein U9R75_09540, partial [Candidatus Thermoplasmatota archaeon]|nr:hypothetical protein [Candidatus Thermoplasmatota archaeon]
NVTGLELGSSPIKVVGNCWGVERCAYFNIEVVRSIGKISFEIDDKPVHTGDTVKVHLNVTDLLGDDLLLNKNEVVWSVEGDQTIMFSDETDIHIIPRSPGIVEVNAVVDIGRANGSISESITVYSAVSYLRIFPMESQIFTGKAVVISAELINWENQTMDEVLTNWTITGLAQRIRSTAFDLTLVPLSEEEINISVEAVYFNETYQDSISFTALSDVSRLELDSDTINIPLGATISRDITLINDLNEIYTGRLIFSLEVEIDLFISPSISDRVLSVVGKNIGSSELTIIAITPFSEVREVIKINVFEPLEEIRLKEPLKIVRNVPSTISLEFIGRDGSILDLDHYSISSNSGSIYSSNDKTKVIVQDTRPIEITIIATYFSSFLESNFTVDVVPRAVGISINDTPPVIRLDSTYVLKGKAILENSETSDEIIWTSMENKSYSYSGIGSNLNIRFNKIGNNSVKLVAWYHDQELETTLNFLVYDLPLLTSLELLSYETPDGRIIEVEAYDQYGINITYLCLIEWDGSFSQLDNNKIFTRDNSISVFVTYDGITLSEKRVDRKESGISFTFFLIVCTALILSGIFLLILFMHKKRSNGLSMNDQRDLDIYSGISHQYPETDDFKEDPLIPYSSQDDLLMPFLNMEE